MNIILLLSKKQETISLEVKTLQIEFAFCPNLLIFPVKADSSYFSNIFMRAPTFSHARANFYFEISRIFLKSFEVSVGAPYLHTPWNKQNGIRTFLFVIFYLFQFFNVEGLCYIADRQIRARPYMGRVPPFFDVTHFLKFSFLSNRKLSGLSGNQRKDLPIPLALQGLPRGASYDLKKCLTPKEYEDWMRSFMKRYPRDCQLWEGSKYLEILTEISKMLPFSFPK